MAIYASATFPQFLATFSEVSLQKLGKMTVTYSPSHFSCRDQGQLHTGSPFIAQILRENKQHYVIAKLH